MTALHPRTNGEVERFIKSRNKTEQIASLQGKNRLERRNAVQDMLIPYRSTSHPATEVAPYEAVKGTPVRTKLDYTEPETQRMGRMTSPTKETQKTKQQREGRKTRQQSATRRQCASQAT